MTVREQVEAVRDSGRVNMFDSHGVQAVAAEMGLHELAAFIEDRRGDYLRFILSGDEEALSEDRSC